MMRGRKVLRLFAGLRTNSDIDRSVAVADRLDLDLTRRVGLMSTGMRQKLALAITMSVDCPLWILDEPTANLDPTVRGQILDMVREARVDGRTILFSSHVLSEIEDVCDHAAIMRRGSIVFQTSLATLQSEHRIRAKIDGDLPPLPETIADLAVVRKSPGAVEIDAAGELQPFLSWLASLPIRDLSIAPVGLRSVYDRFHRDPVATEETGATV